jgi:hypothetical protein
MGDETHQHPGERGDNNSCCHGIKAGAQAPGGLRQQLLCRLQQVESN